MSDTLLAQEDSAEYEAALSAVHRKFAERLLSLCQRNGGIYIKGAQIITSIPAVRPEYRTCGSEPWLTYSLLRVYTGCTSLVKAVRQSQAEGSAVCSTHDTASSGESDALSNLRTSPWTCTGLWRCSRTVLTRSPSRQ
jgi:hypothetical protein